MRAFFHNTIFILIAGLISCGGSDGMSLDSLSQSVSNEPSVQELQGRWYFTWTLESDECDLASLDASFVGDAGETSSNSITITETDCQIDSSTSISSSDDVQVIQDCFAGATMVAMGLRVSASNEECSLSAWEDDILELNEDGNLEGTFEGSTTISGTCLSEFSDALADQLPKGCSFSGTVRASQAEILVENPSISSDVDSDYDGVIDDEDNCLYKANGDQTDSDGDGVGDVCEEDNDYDGMIDDDDNCEVYNPNQEDLDEDSLGDACEPDSDNDGKIDDLDNCPEDYNSDQNDSDGDDIGNACDTPNLTNVTIQPISQENMADMIADFLDN